MADEKLLTPPTEVVQAIGLPRDVCRILVLAGDLSDKAWCADDPTMIGCRAMAGGSGCLLRDTGLYRDGSTSGFRIDNLQAAGYKIE